MSARALGAGIAAGDFDPVALCEHFLARIEGHDAEHGSISMSPPST